jgi:hypothetical protein
MLMCAAVLTFDTTEDQPVLLVAVGGARQAAEYFRTRAKTLGISLAGMDVQPFIGVGGSPYAMLLVQAATSETSAKLYPLDTGAPFVLDVQGVGALCVASPETAGYDALMAGRVDPRTGEVLAAPHRDTRPCRTLLFQDKRGPLPQEGRARDQALAAFKAQAQAALAAAHPTADVKVLTAELKAPRAREGEADDGSFSSLLYTVASASRLGPVSMYSLLVSDVLREDGRVKLEMKPTLLCAKPRNYGFTEFRVAGFRFPKDGATNVPIPLERVTSGPAGGPPRSHSANVPAGGPPLPGKGGPPLPGKGAGKGGKSASKGTPPQSQRGGAGGGRGRGSQPQQPPQRAERSSGEWRASIVAMAKARGAAHPDAYGSAFDEVAKRLGPTACLRFVFGYVKSGGNAVPCSAEKGCQAMAFRSMQCAPCTPPGPAVPLTGLLSYPMPPIPETHHPGVPGWTAPLPGAAEAASLAAADATIDDDGDGWLPDTLTIGAFPTREIYEAYVVLLRAGALYMAYHRAASGVEVRAPAHAFVSLAHAEMPASVLESVMQARAAAQAYPMQGQDPVECNDPTAAEYLRACQRKTAQCQIQTAHAKAAYLAALLRRKLVREADGEPDGETPAKSPRRT